MLSVQISLTAGGSSKCIKPAIVSLVADAHHAHLLPCVTAGTVEHATGVVASSPDSLSTLQKCTLEEGLGMRPQVWQKEIAFMSLARLSRT